MRLALALILLLLANPVDAATAQGLPHIRVGAPYSAVRKQLIAAGYAPARFVDLDERFCAGTCTGELYSCFATDPICDWVFVRRADDALFVVETRYEGWKIKGRPDVSGTHRFLSMGQTSLAWLDDVDIILPDGRRLSHRGLAARQAGAADRR